MDAERIALRIGKSIMEAEEWLACLLEVGVRGRSPRCWRLVDDDFLAARGRRTSRGCREDLAFWNKRRSQEGLSSGSIEEDAARKFTGGTAEDQR